jgi:hypothetical protein
VTGLSNTKPLVFRARLTEAGLAVEDSCVLCRAYVETTDWGEVGRRALRENLLGKGSAARIAKLLGAVNRRVINAQDSLSFPLLLAKFLASDVPAAAKAQLLFILALREDAAFAEGYQHLVVPALTGVSRRVPAKPDIVAFLETAVGSHPEVAKWTGQTRLRWAEGFRLVLREVGMITRAKGNQEMLNSPVVRDETISFLCHALADSGVSGWSILRHEIVRPLLLTEVDGIRAARALNVRSWWTYAQNGEIVEFRRNHPSLEEWLNHALGQ